MPRIPRPEVDRRSFGPELLKYHERLVPFLDGAIGAIGAFRDFVKVTREPVRVAVPDDWVTVTFAAGSGFFSPVGTNQRLQYRATEDGTVKLRGVFGNTAPPAAGTLISALTPDVLPPSRETLVMYTEAPVTLGSISISDTGLRYETGAINGISASGLEWTSSSRSPLAWGGEWPVYIPYTGTPLHVLVSAVRLTSAGRQTSERLTLPAWWDDDVINSTPGFALTRVPGLRPGSTYNLTVYVMPA